MDKETKRFDELSELWRRYLGPAEAYTSTSKDLRRLSFEKPDLIVPLMRRALTSPEERDVALNFVPLLPPPAQEQLLDALLPLAAELDVGSCNRAAQILLSLPREWLVKELKQSVSRFLDNEDEITPE
jgi:hypothetical protein